MSDELELTLEKRRAEVTDEIFTMLTTELPNVTWTKIFKGFQRGKGTVGSLVSDHIDFTMDAKDQVYALQTFVIIIADSENIDVVDVYGDRVFELLEFDDINGKATIGQFKTIKYAAAPNKAEAGAVLLIYEVKYYV